MTQLCLFVWHGCIIISGQCAFEATYQNWFSPAQGRVPVLAYENLPQNPEIVEAFSNKLINHKSWLLLPCCELIILPCWGDRACCSVCVALCSMGRPYCGDTTHSFHEQAECLACADNWAMVTPLRLCNKRWVLYRNLLTVWCVGNPECGVGNMCVMSLHIHGGLLPCTCLLMNWLVILRLTRVSTSGWLRDVLPKRKVFWIVPNLATGLMSALGTVTGLRHTSWVSGLARGLLWGDWPVVSIPCCAQIDLPEASHVWQLWSGCCEGGWLRRFTKSPVFSSMFSPFPKTIKSLGSLMGKSTGKP